jgi:hypothetical protein
MWAVRSAESEGKRKHLIQLVNVCLIDHEVEGMLCPLSFHFPGIAALIGIHMEVLNHILSIFAAPLPLFPFIINVALCS